MGRIFNIKTILILVIMIGAGYLTSKFPYEGVLIGGICIILVIGIWLLQAERENE